MSRTAKGLWTAALHDITELVHQEELCTNGQEIKETCGPMYSCLAATSVMPALWSAAMKGGMAEVRELLAEGADIQETGGLFKSSPLHIACLHSHQSIALLLIRKGADVSAADKDKRTPLHYAAHQSGERVVALLLEQGADVAAKDTDGWTPLHDAAALHSEVVAQLLLDRGADASARTNSGRTPEDVARAGSHHELAAMLKAVRRPQCVAFATRVPRSQ